MSFFHISPKTFTVIVIYLTLVYTLVYSFGVAGVSNELVVVTPDVVPVEMHKVTSDEQNQSEDVDTGFLFAIFGVVAGVLIVVTGGWFALAIPIIGSGLFGGFLLGVGVSNLGRALDVELPFSGFLNAIKGFFGAILDLFLFIGKFMTFGLISDTGIVIPSAFGWLIFLMTFPVWIYMLIIVAGFSVEAWKAVKAW